jgi:ESCRT-I complex subunit VPS28
MDHPAALHRLKVGVPATIEHSSEAGPETSKWVAETTQVRSDHLDELLFLIRMCAAEFYHLYGRPETPHAG